MRKYKAIALDLDGTLKNSNNEIMPETKQILMELADNGVAIILASGRPTHGMRNESEQLGLMESGGYVLSFNGARVVEEKTKQVIYERFLSKEVTHKIYQRAKEYHLAVMTYHDTYIVTEDEQDGYVQVEADINDMAIHHVDDFIETVQYNVNKVLLTGKPTYVAEILEGFSKPLEDTVSVYRSAPFFIEVMDQGVDKASSLEVVLRQIGIKQEELIAFGDGYNDLSMITYAGLGVAMGNAIEEVKEKANIVTQSNDEEGIAICLQKLKEKGEI